MKIRAIAPALAVLALVGCGTAATSSTPPRPAHAVHRLTAEQRYLAAVGAAGLGNRDLSSPAAVAALTGFGHAACQPAWYADLPRGAGYRRLVRTLLTRVPGASRRQAEILVGSAVRDLCPWFASYLPPGAP